MKPTKNQVFCIGCQKHKMLFESKSKADNFIKYNSGDILEENEKAPVRSYYCTLCIGWHVTSNPSTFVGERLDGRDEKLINRISQYKQNKEDIGVISQRINNKLQEFEMHLYMGEFDKAEDVLDVCELEVDDAKSFTMVLGKVGRLQEKVRKARERLDKYLELYNMDKEEQNELLNNPNPSKDEREVMLIIKDLHSQSAIKSVIANQDLIVNSDDTPMVLEIVDKCREYIEMLSGGEGAKRAKSHFKKTLDQIVSNRHVRMVCGQKDELAEIDPTKNETNIDANSKPTYSSEYKTNILELIQKIERMGLEFEAENYEECEDILDLCFYILNDMKEDTNTRMIMNQLDSWKQRLENRS